MRGGIDEVKDYPLSDADIRRILGNNIRILTYPDLKNLRSIDECFDDQGRCILLFLTSSPTEGHWVCMLRKKKGIEFFDPYGDSPEEVKDDIPRTRREMLDMNQPYLTRLMKASGLPVYYNTYPFQQDKASVNTCGRWCVARCLYAPKSLDYFHKVVMKAKAKGMSPDDFVSGLTANWLKK